MTLGHPQFGDMCEICCTGLTPEMCAVDMDGVRWDVCSGACACEAGIAQPWRLFAGSVAELRAEVERRLAGGVDRGRIEAELNGVFVGLQSEGNERAAEYVAGVLDLLTGWCAPSARIPDFPGDGRGRSPGVEVRRDGPSG